MSATAMMGLLQMTSGAIGGYGQIQAGKFQSEIAQQNAAFRELDALDVILRGKQQSQRIRRTASQTKGEIELAAGAQGQEVGAGTVAGNLMAEAEILSEQDVQLIRNNATREAFGYRKQARDMISQSQMNEAMSWGQAGGSLATGGLAAYQTMSKTGKTTPLGKEAKTGLKAGGSYLDAGRKA